MVDIFRIENNDSHIIYRDRLIIDITRSMHLDNDIKIVLNGEGPCVQSLGLYQLLDNLTDVYGYDRSRISIVTCNLIEQHDYYNIQIKPQMMYLDSARKFISQNTFLSKQFNKEFKHFGNFIGHGNLYRLHIATYLHEHHCALSLQTYHFNKFDLYHRPFIGLEDMILNDYKSDEILSALRFLSRCPIKIDEILKYPILNPETLNISKIYYKFFVEIVNLTYFTGTTFYIDEKIWRPIIMKTPFLIQGPKNFIKNFKKLGFQTFDRWWDEGYSEDPERSQIDGILKVVDQISKLSIKQLHSMYNDMSEVLLHNQNLLMRLDKSSFIDFVSKRNL